MKYHLTSWVNRKNEDGSNIIQDGDIVFVYYCGYGSQSNNKQWLHGIDSRMDEPVEDMVLSVNFIQDIIATVMNKHGYLIMMSEMSDNYFPMDVMELMMIYSHLKTYYLFVSQATNTE